MFTDVQPIPQQSVHEIASRVARILKMNIFTNIGSAGYKEQSGDMDLMLDANEVKSKFSVATDMDAKQEIAKLFQNQGYQTKISGRNVHIRFPLNKSFVQIDLMVVPNAANVAPFHQHGPRGNYKDPNFKGSYIFILISSIAKSMNLKFDAFSGKLVKRDTNEVIANNRDSVAKILLNPAASGDSLNSVQSILAALSNDPHKDAKLAQAKEDERKGLIKL